VGVALVTLFDADGEVLVAQTAVHARRLVDRGVTSITLAGTTGEASFLTAAERVELCTATKQAVAGRVPVIVGTGHADQGEAIRLTAAAREAGADAGLVLSPPGVEDPHDYYAAVADAAGPMPILAYHFPAVSPPGVPVESLSELPVAGIKDSSGDAERLVTELANYDGALYVGSTAYLALAGPLGATGAILALANVEPELCVAAFSGDIAAQRRLIPLHLELRSDFPGSLKRRLAETAHTSTAVRAALP
jgi:4-hydroxy-tetrahydrodipicolinate synthase